jgi:hypothetical protein
VTLVSVDDQGNRVFSDADVDKLAEVDSAVVGAIYDAARLHCGFAPNDIESLVKNSSAGQVAGKNSD